MRKYLAAFGVAAALLTGCSAQATTSSAPAPVSTAPAVATPSPTPTPTAAADATSVATALKAKVKSITKVTTVTEAMDENQLLGRNGQYTSLAWITDKGATAGKTGSDGGAVVEMFANAEDAKARSEYIQKVLKAMGPAAGTEWHHLDGATLLRVNGKLSPSVNAQYTAAFGK
ncbi:hypothetical protein SAMN05660473_00180 [Arthrobacter sp. 49Tsu3.1M3]|jgi:3-oxoacyl-ACP reductase-like protein|uniref:hypothetical protein n=1 Tax=Arthrobacter sp. 49Tsu3.1M3 TaxID=1279029 RepID=UPI0009A904CD|nr:hypothetical protein [Arthrobacter sp. 49Tsu3.1M3]SKB33836.1 hypothetical protein SAMN05660473_00180 [Arthrobacter sp. 49Tsu3.1M3]